jgi:hypothetical protein
MDQNPFFFDSPFLFSCGAVQTKGSRLLRYFVGGGYPRIALDCATSYAAHLANTASDIPLSSLLVWLLTSAFQGPSDNRACETREPKNSVDSSVACVSDFCYGLEWHLGRHSDPLILLYGRWNVTAVSNHDVNNVWRQCRMRKLRSCAVQCRSGVSAPDLWKYRNKRDPFVCIAPQLNNTATCRSIWR